MAIKDINVQQTEAGTNLLSVNHKIWKYSRTDDKNENK